MGEKDLTPWKPGQSGNPKGREKGSLNRKTILKRFLSSPTDEVDANGVNLTAKEAIIVQQIRNALDGDLPAFKALMEFDEGKAQDNKKIEFGALGALDKKKKLDLLVALVGKLGK